VRDVFTAKTMLPEVRGQDGGVVTSMLLYAVEDGLIDSAVATTKSNEELWKRILHQAKVKKVQMYMIKKRGKVYE
jgi:coenzyme F420 hydrogenase subunit beta